MAKPTKYELFLAMVKQYLLDISQLYLVVLITERKKLGFRLTILLYILWFLSHFRHYLLKKQQEVPNDLTFK